MSYSLLSIYIDDILLLSKIIEQYKDDVLAVIHRCINNVIIIDKNKCIYAEQEIKFLGVEITVGQIIIQKYILEKIEIFPEKIEDKKQLEYFLECLSYASDFIKDLAKLRKLLLQKLSRKKDIEP